MTHRNVRENFQQPNSATCQSLGANLMPPVENYRLPMPQNLLTFVSVNYNTDIPNVQRFNLLRIVFVTQNHNDMNDNEMHYYNYNSGFYTVSMSWGGSMSSEEGQPDGHALLLLPRRHFSMGHTADDIRYWSTVYRRLVHRNYLASQEVACADFVYVVCGPTSVLSHPPEGQIRWLCPTRSLAYIVRIHLNRRWEVAQEWFLDKNGRPLPPSFHKTNPPKKESTLAEIESLFA